MDNHAAALIIPVESQVRELDAKLLVACAVAERGFAVYLGSRRYINFAMPNLPRGVFLAKSLRGISVRLLRIIRDLGHEIVAWDEESLVRFNAPDYYPWRFSTDTFALTSRLFAWGADDAELFANYPGYTGAPIHVTGNPRTDLLRKEMRNYFAPAAAELRARHGDFILVNTNFSFVNNFVPSLNLLTSTGMGSGMHVSRTGWGMGQEFAAAMYKHQGAIFEAFRALLPKLGDWFPDRQIILRPHPSEDHEVWRALTSPYRNIQVLHEGNVAPWLMACRVLLHNGCTTAVEAALLDTPSVTYMPVASAQHDYDLPNALSHCARTENEVHQHLGDILAGRLGLTDEKSRQRLFDRHVTSASGALAADRFVTVLVNQGLLQRPPAKPALAKYLWARLHTRLRTAEKRVLGLLPGSQHSAAYHAHRFPDLTEAEINRRIGRFSALLGRFADVQGRKISEHVFLITGPRSNYQAIQSRRTPKHESTKNRR